MIFVFLCLTYLLNFCNNFLDNLNSDSLILPPHCFESDTSKLQIQPCLTPFLIPSMALFLPGDQVQTPEYSVQSLLWSTHLLP